jgi:hypothetical protein
MPTHTHICKLSVMPCVINRLLCVQNQMLCEQVSSRLGLDARHFAAPTSISQPGERMICDRQFRVTLPSSSTLSQCFNAGATGAYNISRKDIAFKGLQTLRNSDTL